MHGRIDFTAVQPRRTAWKTIILAVLGSMLLAWPARLLIHAYFFFPFEVPTDSMAPDLKKGQSVTIIRPGEGFDRKGIYLLDHPYAKGYYLLLKAVAIEGDEVQASSGQILVNGQPVASKRHILREFSMKIKKGESYLLSNDSASVMDSSAFGPLPYRLVSGKIKL